MQATSAVNQSESSRPAVPRIGVGGCQISERGKALVMQVLDSNRLSAGPMMDRFEKEIARLHGRRHGLMCNSGTSALQIALAALKEREGWSDEDEVLVPAITFIATSNSVLFNHLTPVFVDVEPDYFGVDPAQIERHITPRTRAIMPVHIGGQICDMDPILEIAKRHNLRVVEDSAECMFVRYRGRPVGCFGDIACFSTYVAHIVTTGVGGLCVSDDGELHVAMRSWMNHGRDSIYLRIDDDQGLDQQQLHEVVSRRFSFVRLGHSFRATEMEAALGLAQLEEREQAQARRTTIARRYDAGLTDLGGQLQLPAVRPDAEHAYMFYPIVTQPGVSRDRLVEFLEDRGIETRYLLPLINQPVYLKLFGDLNKQYPVAARLNRDAFYIGCHAGLTEQDVEYVIDCMHEFFGTKA
jgi:dTDP-4-amino-4,6-dideoxygalactose transaminase